MNYGEFVYTLLLIAVVATLIRFWPIFKKEQKIKKVGKSDKIHLRARR